MINDGAHRARCGAKLLAITVAAAVTVIGCGSTTSTSTTTSTTAAAVPPAAPASGPASGLVPSVTLPVGSLRSDGGKPVPGIEMWAVPTNYDYTVEYMRNQLPTNAAFEGLAWCSQDINLKVGSTQWSWGDTAEMILVHVSRSGSVTITRGPDTVGC